MMLVMIDMPGAGSVIYRTEKEDPSLVIMRVDGGAWTQRSVYGPYRTETLLQVMLNNGGIPFEVMSDPEDIKKFFAKATRSADHDPDRG